ncbi:carboxypeptidase-like regulatory domain-containing protein [Sphingobacterium siyangense]|uniref:carboxypeptidase-like regulatory domain-containing protein n=1 Tax=Sphingobacterium siyangense TaxID=459529 RepID=UPI0019661CE8|nr:carboxypeptidase-like regulatory domain-containing protein [Sphingobacterium siyangense]QRY57252.1 carboxypeptidase-like regulatory domain-containing protein [Sphingobacterium siyangense]
MSRMKLLLLLLFIANLSSAQDLKGTIKDKHSGEILIGVSIKLASRSTYSDSYGNFILSGIKLGDTITFSSIGYREEKYIVDNSNLDNLVIYMKQTTILLDEVKINSLRNYKADSLKFREEFTKTFNYSKPKFKDIFINKNYSSNVPRHPNQASNSTASLISVDVLSVISMLGKNRTPQSKLQQKLIKEEEEQSLDNTFSKRKVQNLTGLKGDSLQTFMQLYRPNIDAAKYMSEYDIILYIKKCYHEYIEP